MGHAHRPVRLRLARGPHRAAAGFSARCRAAPGGAGRRGNRARGSHDARPAGSVAGRRCAGRQRQQSDPGKPSRPPHRPRRPRAGHRRDADQAARRLALERPGETGQAPRGRRRRAFRQRRPRVLPRPARRHRRGQGRGRRGDARLRLPWRGARSGAGGARRHAVAALYRRPPRRSTSATAPTTRPCSRARRVRWRRRPRACTSPTPSSRIYARAASRCIA